MKQGDSEVKGKVPVKEGLFPWPLPHDGSATLMGSHCEGCGQSFFPKRTLCPECQEGGVMKEIPLSQRGTLYTYAIIRQAPAGFEPPYATALVDLPEGVRLFAQLTTADLDEIKLDEPVELTFGPIARDKAGNEVISYLFRLAKER